MNRSLEALEARMSEARSAAREAARAGDKAESRRLRALLRALEDEWADQLESGGDHSGESAARQDTNAGGAGRPVAGTIPVREQVYQALTVLGAPAAPKLISSVHEAFFADAIVTTKLASLRRDEAGSFKSQPYARPYYICSALTFDRLAPARGLLAVSTWPLESRIVGPLGPRVDFLRHATHIAEQIQRIRATGHEPTSAAIRLLRRFAANIPGAGDTFADPDPDRVLKAAKAEADVHAETDSANRRDAADRANAQLDDAQRLFGAPQLGVLRSTGTDTDH